MLFVALFLQLSNGALHIGQSLRHRREGLENLVFHLGIAAKVIVLFLHHLQLCLEPNGVMG